MVSLIVSIRAMCVFPIIPQHIFYAWCKTAFDSIYEVITGTIKETVNPLIALITQYCCNRFSNCTLEHGRPLDRGHLDCDFIMTSWTHKNTICFFFHGHVRRFVGLSYFAVHKESNVGLVVFLLRCFDVERNSLIIE